MNLKPITVGVAAEAIANGAKGDAEKKSLERQIRTWIQTGVIRPATYLGKGKTAAAILSPGDVCRARILYGLVSTLRLDNSVLSRISARMDSAIDEVSAKSFAETGTVWDLIVAIRRDSATGEPHFSSGFSEADKPPPGRSYLSESDFRSDISPGMLMFEMRLVVPVTAKVYPIGAWLKANGYA